MTFKQVILNTAAVSAVLLGVTAFSPAPFSIASVAHADTNISVNFGIGTFYDRLEPYGSWVSFEDRYVFVPKDIARGWRPYTLGQWSYTNRYGWLWVSTERFGWATYHYGRWGYSRNIGWYWVPGHRWAPAWVVWSHTRNEIAWAPLPPRRGTNVDVEISITIGDVPDYYWQAVPTSAFLSINLSDKIIRDRNQIRTIVQQSTPETVRIENNIVVNNVIQVNEIEQATNTKVQVLQEKAVTTPDAAGKIDVNSVAIFNPEVKVDPAAKPKQAVKVEEIETQRKAQGIQADDVAAEQPDAAAPALDKNGKPVDPASQKNKTAVSPPVDTGNATTDAPLDQSKKKVKEDAAVPQDTQQNAEPKQADQQPSDQQKNKKKKKDAGATDEQPVDQNATAPVDEGNATTDAPVDPSKKKANTDQNSDQKGVKKGTKGKDKCDPNVEDCPPSE